jgi:hypothetical protein
MRDGVHGRAGLHPSPACHNPPSDRAERAARPKPACKLWWNQDFGGTSAVGRSRAVKMKRTQQRLPCLRSSPSCAQPHPSSIKIDCAAGPDWKQSSSAALNCLAIRSAPAAAPSLASERGLDRRALRFRWTQGRLRGAFAPTRRAQERGSLAAALSGDGRSEVARKPRSEVEQRLITAGPADERQTDRVPVDRACRDRDLRKA